MPLRNFTHGTLKLRDGAAKEITVGPGPGNVSIQGLEADDREQEAVYDRGEFLERVPKRKKAVQVTVTFLYNDQVSSASESVMHALKKIKTWSGGTTVDPGGQVWALDAELTIDRAGESDVWTMSNCRPVTDMAEGDPTNGFSVTMDCVEGVDIS